MDRSRIVVRSDGQLLCGHCGTRAETNQRLPRLADVVGAKAELETADPRWDVLEGTLRHRTGKMRRNRASAGPRTLDTGPPEKFAPYRMDVFDVTLPLRIECPRCRRIGVLVHGLPVITEDDQNADWIKHVPPHPTAK